MVLEASMLIAYTGMIVFNLLPNIYKLFSITVVRFVEMNFEQFQQQSQPYALRIPEKN